MRGIGLCLQLLLCVFVVAQSGFLPWSELNMVKEQDLLEVTASPTFEPTAEPFVSFAPTFAPTTMPTLAPSAVPTLAPSAVPTAAPSAVPTIVSTDAPTETPTAAPTGTLSPSAASTTAPSLTPTVAPSKTPTAAPSMLPTRAPNASPAPTYAPTQQVTPILTFESTISLQNVGSTTLSDSDKQAIVDSCASAMGVSSSQVTFVSYTATSRRLRDGEKVAMQTNFAATISTSVPTTTSTSTTQYEQLTAALTPAAINSNLQTYAVSTGSTALLSATASSVTNTEPVVVTPPSSDSNNNLSGGAIAGIVIGVVVGVALLVAIIYYFVTSQSNANRNEPLVGADKTLVDIKLDL